MRPTNQEVAGKPAGVERLDKQPKQFRVRDEQLEKQTAQAVSFHEPKELVQSRVRITSFCQPIEQSRAQFPEYLASSGSHVETRRASFKISQRFLRSLRVVEKFQANFRGLQRRSRNDPSKNRPDRAHPVLQCRCEIVRAREAQASGKMVQCFRLVRQRVGLLFGFDLQAVFDTTEKSIRVVQRQNFLRSKQIQFSQRAERLQHVRFLQKRMTRPVNKLQRLYDEFDVANSAASKFYVALQFLRTDNVAFDAMLDFRNLVQQIRCGCPRIDERLM